MNIKEQLKSIDVKVSKLAAGLEISRPTFDAYIDLFEKGEKIPNQAYQEIFEYLFSETNDSAIEFAQKYDYVKRTMLADFKSGMKESEDTKRRHFLVNAISSLVANPDTSKEELEFAYLFLNKADAPIIRLLRDYFCLTNGITDWQNKEMSEEEKAFFSSLYFFFKEYKDGQLKIDQEQLNELLENNAKATGHRTADAGDKKLLAYLAEKGIDPSLIDIDTLKQMLANKD